MSLNMSAGKCRDCHHHIFCNLHDRALRRFGEIGIAISFPGRSILFAENQRADGVFVVCNGQLKLSTISKEGRTMILRLAGPGDVLGLSATMGNLPHEVTAETLEPTRVKSLRKGAFLDLLEKHSEVGKNASKALAKEYHDVFLDARRLALSGSAAGRLAQLLIEWARTAPCGKPKLRFTMALTHEELSSMAGTSRETVTRLLNRFERDKLITRRGTSLTIVNPVNLAALVQ